MFSSDECSVRVARRMSFTIFSAGAFVVTGFFLISTSMWGQDEPQTFRYAITPNCWDNAVVESFFHLLKRDRIRR